jgi:hypothetical protein
MRRLAGRHEASPAPHFAKAGGIWVPRGREQADFPINVVFDTTDADVFLVDQHVRGARITIPRESDASGVGNRQAVEAPRVGSMDVAVDHTRSARFA